MHSWTLVSSLLTLLSYFVLPGLFRKAAECNHECCRSAAPAPTRRTRWTVLATFPPSLPLFPLDALLCLYGSKKSSISPFFPTSSAPYLPLSVSPSLFHPSLRSSAGWLIVAPQLRGWHMHQSLTNTTWSPETHSSTKNASVCFPLSCSHSVFVIFPYSPCSQTRVCFLPVCRTITLQWASEEKKLHCATRTPPSSMWTKSWRSSICFIRQKTTTITTTLHLFRPVLLTGVNHGIQDTKAVFKGDCCVNSWWGFSCVSKFL